MGGEWTRVRLADLCEFRAGSVFKPEYQGQNAGAYPFVKVSDMNLPENSVRIQAANNWVSESDIRALKAKPLPQGTVVFAKIGEALRQNRLRQVVRDTVVDNNMMGAIPRRERVDPAFFYYALAQFNFADIAHGTALPYLTVASLSTLELACPPLAEQRAIARILGALDDKIELNRKTNATLEAMARALFKSWFVDFDPVRAKAEGRDPSGMDAETAKVFPSELVESELGPIPRGWRVVQLSDVASITSGKRPTERHDVPTSAAPVPLFGGGGVMAYVGEALLRQRAILTGRVGTLGLLFRVTEPVWPSDNTLIVQTKSDFDFDLVRFRLELVDFASLNRGSTQPLLTQRDLGAQRFVHPSEGLRVAFASIVEEWLTLVAHRKNENTSLSGVRDALLPRLLSGELSVNAAKHEVETTL